MDSTSHGVSAAHAAWVAFVTLGGDGGGVNAIRLGSLRSLSALTSWVTEVGAAATMLDSIDSGIVAMKASKDTVVGFHYELKTDGEVVENSRDNEQSLQILLGRGQLIPGMEKAMEGHEAGDRFEVELAPEEAYGPRKEGMTQKKYFQDAKHLKPGMSTVLHLKEGGQRVVVVQKVGMTTIDIDLNHPMAGKTLHFDIELLDVREATAEELEHGHAHGPGGHEH